MALADSFNECHFHEPYLAIQTHKRIIHIIPDICAKVYVTSKRIPKNPSLCRLCLQISLLAAFGKSLCLSAVQDCLYWQFFRLDNSLYYISALVDNKKPMTYDQKVGRFCIKSGPLTGRKRATNSMKANGCDLLNVQSYKAYKTFRLKGKTYKIVTIFGVFLICRLMQSAMTAEKNKKKRMSKSCEH